MPARGGGRVVGVVFRLALPGLLGLAAPCPAHAAAPAGQWWNAGYRYRQQLSLTSGTTPIPTQYSVRLQLDHAALVSVSKSLGRAADSLAFSPETAWELLQLPVAGSTWKAAGCPQGVGLVAVGGRPRGSRPNADPLPVWSGSRRLSGCHGRLGDAILAAQRTYTQSGLMPELLAIYQLLGDPAMPVR